VPQHTTGHQLAIRLTRATTNVRAFPLVLLLLITALRLLRILPPSGGAWIQLGTLVWLTGAIAARRVRPPKNAVAWAGPELPDWIPGPLNPEVLVRSGSRVSAQVRGFASPAIVINAQTAHTWMKNEAVRRTQYAHEIGHVGMGDSLVYGVLSTGLLLATLNEFILISYAHLPVDWVFIATLALGWLSLRSYLRAREYAADRIALGVVGPHGEYVMQQAVEADRPSLPLFGTHPQLQTRLAALKQPLKTPFVGMLPVFAVSGFMALLAAANGYRVLIRFIPALSISIALWLSLAAASLVVGVVLSRPLGFAYAFLAGKTLIAWICSLLLGESLGIIVGRGNQTDRLTLLTALLGSLCLGIITGYVVKLVLLVSGIAEMTRSDVAVSSSLLQRLFLLVSVATSFYILSYLALSESGRSLMNYLLP
jgi:hypothetical protein